MGLIRRATTSTSLRGHRLWDDAHVVKRVFEPFYTTKPVGVGTGRACPCLRFAKQSGGSVTVDSEGGRGTKVTILLPRHQGEHTPVTTSEGEPRHRNNGTGKSSSCRGRNRPSGPSSWTPAGVRMSGDLLHRWPRWSCCPQVRNGSIC